MSAGDREDEERQRARRASARATWTIRRTELAGEGHDDPWIDPRQSLAAMWPLMIEAWTRSGRTLPTYSRDQAPGAVWRAGSIPPEHALRES